MEIKRFIFNNFMENTYVVWDKNTRQCAIIDPGMMSVAEENKLVKFITDNRLVPVHLINTHIHIDHVVGNKFIEDIWHLPVEANVMDAPLGNRVKEQAQMFGFEKEIANTDISIPLRENDKIRIGDSYLTVLHVPGHSPGSIALYDEKDNFIITGDALFRLSIGRTDLPGGDYNTLINALKSKIMTLPGNTIVYPGHGDTTTISQELRYNPFFQ